MRGYFKSKQTVAQVQLSLLTGEHALMYTERGFAMLDRVLVGFMPKLLQGDGCATEEGQFRAKDNDGVWRKSRVLRCSAVARLRRLRHLQPSLGDLLMARAVHMRFVEIYAGVAYLSTHDGRCCMWDPSSTRTAGRVSAPWT